ncbi:AraC family transcriptional regulator [Methylopila capsulata]|uniref:AraC family transcriptional regulator n=1 Tax=Methylopila capsulata TaxID=61654 RepID=A0A9W6IWI0_9HYPH|nr:AraC family transcriptional regulator [Methylopila capsulata]MBM7852185.1 AraC family transcriptional regulator [Methylopila capsulata]GLK56391.1 AraC family transcriptional regulator [Methylopila capsulata]
MLGHSVDKYVNGFLAQTSNARCWSGLLAERWSHAAGELPSLVPRDTEVAVLLQGRTVVERAGGGMRQHTHGRRGTIWLCPAGVEEEFVDVVEPIADCLHIFLPARPFDEILLREHDIDPASVELRYETIANDPFIEQVAGQIARELSAETAAGRLLMETLGVALAAHLVHTYASTARGAPQKSPAARPLDAKRLARVTEFIEQRLDGDFTVADLAAVSCMSVAHFARSFRAATGEPPHAFVSARRLSRAKQLLLSDASIADIASTSGFSSQANFTRAFRNATGMTPAQFRKEARFAGGDRRWP